VREITEEEAREAMAQIEALGTVGTA